ncbi:MAG TPA: radical SAM protein, partial [Bacillota bacterium]|nr:radical SAM protein [Bacillota bacterium]
KHYLMERGYLFNGPEEEEKIVEERLSEFQKEIAKSQVQILLIPTYGCNLACTYCYERTLPVKNNLITRETTDAFFDYIGAYFTRSPVKPFITLFGGEPLIDSPAQRSIIRYIVERCAKEDYELAAVTNGYDLESYIDILRLAKIREIQVTLDGPEAVHDRRRATANGQGTFHRIINGLSKAINQGIPINLRTVVDRENLMGLVDLANFLNRRGWLDLGRNRLQTQIGRNYELFDCYAKPRHLMGQVELWTDFVKLSESFPILKKFHRPDFKGIRHLVDTGSMAMASFDTCPAAKTEWVFDLHGNIYGCTASCGREEYKLGSFFPEMSLHTQAIGQWQSRHVLNIPKCTDCSYKLVCGGGCGVIAANKTGEILTPDCRPIQALLELGVNYYRQEIQAMAGSEINERRCCS